MDYHLTLNWPEFIERYWQKRPVVLKRGFSNFVDPISPDELAGLATVLSKAMIISVKTTGRCWCRPSTTGTNPLPR